MKCWKMIENEGIKLKAVNSDKIYCKTKSIAKDKLEH